MAAIQFSPTLLVSYFLRDALGDRTLFSFAENVVLLSIIQWSATFWAAYPAYIAFFLVIAFCETRAEYMNPNDNARETVIEPIAQKNEASHGDGMCPMGFFSGRKAENHPAVPLDATHTVFHLNGPITNISTNLGSLSEPKEIYGKPILYPCDLRHRRTAPFKDRFRHSYLYVGVPVGLHACYSPLLCVDQQHDSTSMWPWRKAWFNLRPMDHGIRGAEHMSLAQKLREFLLSEGADPSEWAYAYLIAVPCVNGQVDNPLGFWYLYNSEKKLTAIIPELNTSYGERRMWLVRDSLEKKPTSGPYSFRGKFNKDIHVSPFMPPTGTGYTIDTCDPCASTTNQLDILVTLRKNEGGPLMVTRVASSAPGLDASTATLAKKLSFLARWCHVPTVTVMTYRILSQAARIYVKAPRYWTRAEPIKTALGKPARAVERTLERYFFSILKDAVENHPSPLCVTYINSGEHSEKIRKLHSMHGQLSKPKSPVVPKEGLTPPSSPTEEEITIHIISPIFYSRFFHYHNAHAALTSELLDDERTRTAWSSSPERFVSLFPSKPEPHTVSFPQDSSQFHWKLISSLRCAPIATNFPRNTAFQSFRGLSAMDEFVLQNCKTKQIHEYRRALLRVYLGEWIGGPTFGPLKRFTDDLEPWGLSRDAVVRIYEAFFKAALLCSARALAQRSTETCLGLDAAFAAWAVAGLNLWACVKQLA